MNNEQGKFEKLANGIGKLTDEKNKAYGDSFAQAGDFLRLLFPLGVPPDKYTDMLAIIRIFDKLKRIATDKDALGESPYADICGYGLLGLQLSQNKKALENEVVKKLSCCLAKDLKDNIRPEFQEAINQTIEEQKENM